jgi:steroid delta-isomerase-like uncharacterized protein
MEKNKETVRRYAEAFSRGDFDDVRALCTDDFIVSGVLGSGDITMALRVWRELHDAFAIKLEIEDLIAEGSQVVARFNESGVFRGKFRGQAPTGKPYRLTAIEWFEFRDGKFARRWGARDSASLMKQVGVE